MTGKVGRPKKQPPMPLPVDRREDWQKEQAARCGCGGCDDYCPCQNAREPWKYGLGPRPSREGDETAEAVAQFLHDEVDLPDKFVDGQWPLHDGDDGYRGGGYVKLQPKDIVEHYRDAAKRLVARFGFRAAQPREGDEADREMVEGLRALQRALEPFAKIALPIKGEAGRPTPLEAWNREGGTGELHLGSPFSNSRHGETLYDTDFEAARDAANALPRLLALAERNLSAPPLGGGDEDQDDIPGRAAMRGTTASHPEMSEVAGKRGA